MSTPPPHPDPTPPPILDYASPPPRLPQLPNPTAWRSLYCGLLVIVMSILPRFLLHPDLPKAISIIVVVILGALWLAAVLGAILFGVIGHRRAQQPNVAGLVPAILGFLVGLWAVGSVVIVCVVSLIYDT